ncbi:MULTISPECIES: class I SAM-dependent methyltransferase [Luteimonas]|uniref:class I SAM-dependent methyltransferase n=1 Tax=Luteimonas TaxID=83614 RepID=UPI000C7BAE43|nr:MULTISPECIES: class I SAM-dependent methyltransferase [Luteimonas]
MSDLAQAKALFFEGLEHHNRHRFQTAEACYRRALALTPDRVSVLVNLSAVLIAQSKFDEAAMLCRRALVIEPGNTECRAHLDACRHAGAPTRQRWMQLEQAVAARPDDAGAHDRLGSAWLAEHNATRALACFDTALRLAPGDTSAGVHRAQALLALDRPVDAVRAYLDCLGHARGSLVISQAALALLIDHGPALAAVAGDPRVDRLLGDGLEAPLVMPQLLAPLVMARLWPELAPRDGGAELPLDVLAGKPLLLQLLTHARITTPAYEILLTRTRQRLLAQLAAVDRVAALDPVVRLAVAVAMQCWRNAYCWDVSDAEMADVLALEARVQGGDGDPFALLAFAMYAPVERVLDDVPPPAVSPLPDAVARLVSVQLTLRAQTRAAAAAMPQLTPIDEATSQRTPPQDEDGPSPRWTSLPPQPARIPLATFARHCIAGAPVLTLPDAPDGMHALVAGCGTGEHAIDLALRLEDLRLLAVDPDRATLGYGAVMAERLGVDRIRFGQADLLQARALDQDFHLIDAAGGLHCMDDAEAGLAALADCLAPQGLLRIALHSRRGRAGLAQCRRWLQAQGATATGIRDARRQVLDLPPEDPRRDVVRFGDFYSTRACRDLLLPAQERQVDLVELQGMLARQGLRPLGLEVPEPVQQAFAREMPGARPDDFAAWDRFEALHPATFERMFFVWAQKPA